MCFGLGKAWLKFISLQLITINTSENTQCNLEEKAVCKIKFKDSYIPLLVPGNVPDKLLTPKMPQRPHFWLGFFFLNCN